jgi:Glutamine synthetase adenylyltransferase
MALRPNGNSGPLVASFNMVEEYLVRQGREWERYAWTKARALTGTEEDIATLEAISRPFIFRRYLDFGSIDALRSMHGQIRAEVKRQEAPPPRPQQQRQAGPGRHPRNRIYQPGVPADPWRTRCRAARPLHPRHPAHAGGQGTAGS